MAISDVLDIYSLKARLWPSLLAGIPLAVGISALIPGVSFPASAGVGAAGAVALMFLLAQVGRSRGKRLEAELFKSWGGKPSVRIMRHRDNTIDPQTKQRYHRNVVAICKDLRMPSAEDEARDHGAADQAYEAATKCLISKTRDTKKFGLLFRENVHYGFCRNAWGLKPLGILCSVLGAAAGGWRIVAALRASETPPSAAVAAAALSGLMLLLWSVWVWPKWVRVPAEAYAERLLEASDALAPKRSLPAKASNYLNAAD